MDENKAQIKVTTVRSLLGLIPYFGTALNESLFEHRSRVKQKRINDFVESLSQYIESLDLDSPGVEHISSNQFGDVFEAILRQVSQTGNRDKIERFKFILANQLITPQVHDFIDTYIDIIAKLSEVQIQILSVHLDRKSKLIKVASELNIAEKEVQRLKNRNKELIKDAQNGISREGESLAENHLEIAKAELQFVKLKEHSEKLNMFRKSTYYSIGEGEFLFFLQDLVSKGLLRDVGIGSVGNRPYSVMEITEFGTGFIKFLTLEKG